MANVHNALTRGPWSFALKAILGATKADGGIERYGETLQGVIDLWSRPEWQFLVEDSLFGVDTTQVAVVAENSIIAIVNPDESQALIVLERIKARGFSAGTRLELRYATQVGIAATLVDVGSPLGRDSRNSIAGGVPIRPVRAARIFVGSDPAFGGVVQDALISVGANDFQEFIAPWVIRPGTAMAVVNQTINTSLEVVYAGRVVQAQPGELIRPQ